MNFLVEILILKLIYLIMSQKADLKNATGMDSSISAEKSDLARLKAEIDKTDVCKLKTVPVDLSKLSNVVNCFVVKKLCKIS